jgi:hypothetical protein
VGNAAAAGVKRRRLTAARARQLIKDFEQVTLQEVAIDHIDQQGSLSKQWTKMARSFPRVRVA